MQSTIRMDCESRPKFSNQLRRCSNIFSRCGFGFRTNHGRITLWTPPAIGRYQNCAVDGLVLMDQ